MYRAKTITSRSSRLYLIVLACLLFSSLPASAAPVTADTATSAVQGWLRQDPRPLGKHLSPRFKRTEAVKNAAGDVLYYVVHLEPSGFVILPADDTADPIVAFSATGNFDPASGSPLADMVNKDLPRRMARARAGAAAAGALKSRGKWRAFLAGSANPPPDVAENGAIVVASQIWVAPFVQTLWNQSDDISGNVACYNYYTPPGAAGAVGNDPCGCVATCMAQVMYYFQYPNTGVGTASFIITNGTFPETTSLLGGNGTGGPYQWANMPLSPNNPSVTQATAIGALTHDAGASVNMSYTPANSAAATFSAEQELISTFTFKNAGYFENDSDGLTGTNLLNMINPNLDARLPVMLGIESQQVVGHCLLCDGYGYSAATLFHHVNTGWGGDNDIWYALPEVDTPDNGLFTLINACVYNIYTNSSSGQIISGRVTDSTGAPVAGATITAVRGAGGTYTATTDANGVYALARIPAASSYTLTATNAGGAAANGGSYSTGASSSAFNALASGNVWGANFVLSPPLLAMPETGFASIGPANGPFSVVSQIYNLTNTTVASINWAVANTNAWLTVTPTNGAVAADAATVFTVSVNSNANNLASGVYAGSIWITNLSNNLAQQLQFSIAVETADYPIAVTGYNEDVVVESNAVGGNTFNYADTFDPIVPNLEPPGPVCFYETGLVAENIANNFAPATLGLPSGGIFTNEFDHATIYQFGPYDGENVLYLTPAAHSGSLILNTPAAYKSLSVLAASAQGGGNGTLVIHFTDGTTSPNIAFNAAEYLTTNTPGAGAAITNFGLLAVGGPFNEFSSVDPSSASPNFPFPNLYQTSTNLHAAGLDGKLISSVAFTMPASANTNTATGIFALSGTEALYTGDYTLTVIASPVAGGIVSGGGPFAAGSTTTVTATANGNYLFDNWTQGGNVVSTSSNYTLTLNSNETLVANFLTHYTVTVGASPAGGGAVSGGGTYLQGTTAIVTATTNAGFEFVGWTGDATGTGDTLMIPVEANLNVTANFAVIGANISLTLITNDPAIGSVTVSPKPVGGVLTPGKNYTLTATAKSGNVFSNWTGSLTTNKNPLVFKAEADMVLQANFIPNPFLLVKGIYNGLFTNTDGVTEQTAGMLKGLAVTQKGTYSGALLISGATHAISGSFNLAGSATNLIKRTGSQGNLTLVMTLNANPPAQVTGTVTGPNWTANLTADQATNTLPSAEYTLLLPPDANNSPPAHSPGGDGYALITNNAGTAKITGALADGTALSQTVTVSQDGYVPIYASLYSGKGLLLGWINLELTNTDGVSLAWIHPGTRSGLYTNGFINVLSADQILLAQWTKPANFDSLTNLSMLDTISEPDSATNTLVGVATSGKVTASSGANIGSITPKTGLFTVTIGVGTSKVTGHGAMLNATNGGGYFLSKTNAQAILLGP
jgi:uncharacterized repeat protein (TIGR02543 family)